MAQGSGPRYANGDSRFTVQPHAQAQEPRGPRRALDPEDVLSGRVKVTAAELLRGAHPTESTPPARDLRAREASCATLAPSLASQSLLVRRFGSRARGACPTRSTRSTVSILHTAGTGGTAATPSSMPSTSPARAWVRLRSSTSGLRRPRRCLHARASRGAAPSRRGLPPPRDEEEEPPSEGTRARTHCSGARTRRLASYDYERAPTRLTARAVAASGGAPSRRRRSSRCSSTRSGDDAGDACPSQGSLSRAALDPTPTFAACSPSRRRAPASRSEAIVVDPWQRTTRGPRRRSRHSQRERWARRMSRRAAWGTWPSSGGRDPAHPSVVGLGDELARCGLLRGSLRRRSSRASSRRGAEARPRGWRPEVLARAGPESEARRGAVDPGGGGAAAPRRGRPARRPGRRRLPRRGRHGGGEGPAHAQALAAARGPERGGAGAADARDRDSRAGGARSARGGARGPAPRRGRPARGARRIPHAQRGAPCPGPRGREGPRRGRRARWIDLAGRPRSQGPHRGCSGALPRALKKLAAGDAEAALAAIEPHHAALERTPEARQLAREAQRPALASQRTARRRNVRSRPAGGRARRRRSRRGPAGCSTSRCSASCPRPSAPAPARSEPRPR